MPASAVVSSPAAPTTMRVPVVSFLPGIGDAVRKEFAASNSPAGEMYRSGKLELLDMPLPRLPGNKQNPVDGHNQKDPVQPQWDLSAEQQRVVEEAEVVLMDSHTGGPVFLAPDENLPKDKRHILDNVKWVQATYAGVEMYLKLLPENHSELPASQLPQFTVSRAGGMMPRIMAQYVLGYMTMIERKLLEARDFQANRQYARREMAAFRSAQSVTVGVLGLGDIGQYVGQMLRSAGYKVLGFKRRVSAEDQEQLASCADRVTTELDDVLANSDYLVNVLPSTPATKHLLNEKNLELCKAKSPVFINIGRGDVMAEKILVEALDNGTFSKAVLDVFEQEPLPESSALWTHPAVMLTPHVSGKVFPEDVGAMFLANFNRYLCGEPVRYAVDWTHGY